MVDLDVHVNDTPADLAPFCELPWRKSLEALEKVPQRYLDIPGFAPNFTPWAILPTIERRTTVTSPTQLREDLDLLGVNVAGAVPRLDAAARADQAAGLRGGAGPGLQPLARRDLAGQRPRLRRRGAGARARIRVDAAAEIRRYAGHKGVACVYLPTCCVDPLYGARWYDPMFDAAQECGLPVVLHSVTAINPVFPFNLQRFDTLFSAHVISHTVAMVANAMSMLETGVQVRFPGLDIAFTEGGIAWVPWLGMRLDKEYSERRRDVPLLTERPSHYLQRMFFATQPIEEPEHLADMATLMGLFDGENNVVFASDWPHHDFDHPDKVLQIPLSDEAKAKVMGLNAARLLGHRGAGQVSRRARGRRRPTRSRLARTGWSR